MVSYGLINDTEIKFLHMLFLHSVEAGKSGIVVFNYILLTLKKTEGGFSMYLHTCMSVCAYVCICMCVYQKHVKN